MESNPAWIIITAHDFEEAWDNAIGWLEGQPATFINSLSLKRLDEESWLLEMTPSRDTV